LSHWTIVLVHVAPLVHLDDFFIFDDGSRQSTWVSDSDGQSLLYASV
jgi:hypothetical protein